jgi:hypothetical protein
MFDRNSPEQRPRQQASKLPAAASSQQSSQAAAPAARSQQLQLGPRLASSASGRAAAGGWQRQARGGLRGGPLVLSAAFGLRGIFLDLRLEIFAAGPVDPVHVLLEPLPLVAVEILGMGTQREAEHVIAIVARDLLQDQ